MLTSTQWFDILYPNIPWIEKFIRPLIVYAFLLFIFRIVGKRALGQATLFDFLILLLISNVVQNAIIGQDNSVFGSFVGVVALIGLAGLLNLVSAKSMPARRLLEGMPTLLIYRGQLIQKHLNEEIVSRNDLFMSLRQQGIASLAEVRYAILELDGKISVIRESAPEPADLESCVADAILAQYDDLPTLNTKDNKTTLRP